MQVNYGVVDEGEDSQLELGLAGVSVLDHAGVGVGDRAATKGNVGLGGTQVPRPRPTSGPTPRAQCPLSPPVVDEPKGDGVLGIPGGRRPASNQHHLEAALLPVQPHLDLDLIAGRHAVVLRYGRISDEQLHFRDKRARAVQVFHDSVNPAREWQSGGRFCGPLFLGPPSGSNSQEV